MTLSVPSHTPRYDIVIVSWRASHRRWLLIAFDDDSLALVDPTGGTVLSFCAFHTVSAYVRYQVLVTRSSSASYPISVLIIRPVLLAQAAA